ncbi:MAG TPA: GerAB/ArcD/ProY family transporter [Pseudoneobacillus sp.]|nr:GerAB/ArcD/ProY family transporter [Pseudoneobacillus sp.]
MEQHKGKIGLREYISIVILIIGTKLADDTPAILFQKLSNAAWMVPLFNGLLAIIPIFLLFKVYSYYPNRNLMDIIQIVFGRWFGFLIVLLLWLAGLLITVLDSAIYTDIIGTMYFTKTPNPILYFILMAVSAYGAKKGLEQIGSVATSVIIYIKVSLLIALILTLKKGNLSYLFPIFGPGKWEIVKESSLKLAIFSDFLYLGALLPFIRTFKDFKKGTWISLAILIIEFPLAMIAYISIFDFQTVQLLNYPFHESIRYISLGFLTNLETFFFPFWLVASFVRFSVYLYISAILFGWLFKIKNFEYIIPTLAAIIAVLGMIPETPTFMVEAIKAKTANFFTPAFFFLPLFLWVIAKLRGGSHHGQKS